MPTLHFHRLLLVVPEARIAALRTWWLGQAAQGDLPPDDPATWPPLNATGNPNDPVTHRWCSGAYTNAEVRVLLGRLVQQSAIPFPADWDEKTRGQKKQWVLDQRGLVRQRLGVWIVPIFNDGPWDDPAEALQATGLRVPAVLPA